MEKADLKISSRLHMLAVAPEQSAVEYDKPIRATAQNTTTSRLRQDQETPREHGIL